MPHRPASPGISVAVFGGGHAGVLPEHLREVPRQGEPQAGPNGGQGFVGIAEKAFGLLRFFFVDEVRQGLAALLFEPGGQVRAAHVQWACRQSAAAPPAP